MRHLRRMREHCASRALLAIGGSHKSRRHAAGTDDSLLDGLRSHKFLIIHAHDCEESREESNGVRMIHAETAALLALLSLLIKIRRFDGARFPARDRV